MLKKRDERVNNKKAQQIMGLPFSVIFSIFLIIFFIVIGIFVVRTFLSSQKCAEIKLFVDDFESAVDSAWNSQGISREFTRNLPSNLELVCFADLSKRLDDNDIAFDIEVYDPEDNLFFYPTIKACEIPNHQINHLDIDKITAEKNPYCIPIREGKVVMQIEKELNKRFVGVS